MIRRLFIGAAVAGWLMFVAGVGVFWVNSNAAAGGIIDPTYEMGCQYPGRLTPEGECDNTDPCDPTALKDPVLRGDCAPTTQEEPITEQSAPAVKSAEQMVGTCNEGNSTE